MNRYVVVVVVSSLLPVLLAAPSAHARRIVAAQGLSAPGGSTWSDPQAASIEDSGDIGFFDGSQGIYVESARTITPLAKNGGPVMVGGASGVFGPFSNVVGPLPISYNGVYTHVAKVNGKNTLIRLGRAGTATVILGEGDMVGGAVFGAIVSYVATNPQGQSLIADGNQNVILIDAAGTASLAYRAGQDIPGLAGYKVNSVDRSPQLLDDGRIILVVQGENPGAINKTLHAVLVISAGTATAIVPPGVLAQGDIWSGEDVATDRKGNMVVSGFVYPSSGDSLRASVWVGTPGALTQALTLPAMIDGVMVNRITPVARGAAGRFVANAATSTAGTPLVWFDGTAMNIIARIGMDLPGRTGITLADISSLVLSGDPEVITFSAYCSLSAKPGEICHAILRYATATKTLTTVVATGDMWDGGTSGSGQILQPRMQWFAGAGYGSPVNSAGKLVWDSPVGGPMGSARVLFSEDEAPGAPTPMPGPDVSVEVSGMRVASPTETYVVEIRVANAPAAGNAQGVDLTISANVDLSPKVGAPCTGAGKNLSCSFGAMAPGDAATVSFLAPVQAGTPNLVATALVVPTDVDLSNNVVDFKYADAPRPKSGGSSPLSVTTALLLAALWSALMLGRRRIRIR